MTKETIIKSTLKYLVKKQIEEGSVGFAVDNDPDHDCCWDDVLAWIEAQPTHGSTYGGVSWGGTYKEKSQPSEDCISREAMLSLQTEYAEEISATTFWKLRDDIRKLPSVKPKYTDEEIDKAQAVEQAYVDKMVELAVEESRKKWLNSFDTSSATKCFEAVNLLKQRLEEEE